MTRTAIPAAALVVLLLAGCSSADAEAEGGGCLDVDDALMAAIAEGANTMPLEPVDAAAVKVDGFTDVHGDGSYVVAMEFASEGNIEDGGTEIGTWAVASLDAADAPPILAVDPLADLFTDWPSEVDGVKFTGDEPGVADAAACLT
jgi:hypothetical protein